MKTLESYSTFSYILEYIYIIQFFNNKKIHGTDNSITFYSSSFYRNWYLCSHGRECLLSIVTVRIEEVEKPLMRGMHWSFPFHWRNYHYNIIWGYLFYFFSKNTFLPLIPIKFRVDYQDFFFAFHKFLNSKIIFLVFSFFVYN